MDAETRPWKLRREGVAAVRIAGLPTGGEPVGALGGRAVRPGVPVHLTLRLLLDPVVAHSGRRTQRVLDIGARDLREVPGLLGVIGPDAGEAVGLQLGLPRGAVLALPVVADPVER